MNKQRNSRELVRQGFTLIELLVVVAILGILGTMAVVGLADKPEKARITACETSVKTIVNAAITYNLEKGKMPKSMDDLLAENSDGVPYIEGNGLDPWNNEFKLEVKGKKCVAISAGPDGEFGTSDDIRSDAKGKKNID